MKPLTITIQPPATEHCDACGYEEYYSFNAHHCDCPKCGAKDLGRGPKPAEKQSIYVSKYQASFDLLHPSKKQWHYTFWNVKPRKRFCFVVNEELETDEPLNCAIELKDIFDSYLYSGSKQKIDDLVALMDNDDFQEEQENLRNEEKRIKLETELFKLHVRTNCYGKGEE